MEARGDLGAAWWQRLHRGDEAVTAARSGFDVARLLRIVRQRVAQLADDGLQHRLADVLVSPHRVEQSTLRHQLPGLAGERTQHGERFRRERHRPADPRETRVRLVQLEVAELYVQRT